MDLKGIVIKRWLYTPQSCWNGALKPNVDKWYIQDTTDSELDMLKKSFLILRYVLRSEYEFISFLHILFMIHVLIATTCAVTAMNKIKRMGRGKKLVLFFFLEKKDVYLGKIFSERYQKWLKQIK